jgi:hypothetical protein
MRPGAPSLVTASLLAAAALAGVGCSGGGASEDSASTTSTTGPAQRATAAEVPLAVGQCGDLDRIRAGVAVDPAALRLLPCDQPHLVEVGAVFDYPAGSAVGFPGSEAVDSYATDECVQRFAPYVGAPYGTSTFDVAIVAPDGGGWSDGDRRIACLLYQADFAPVTGSVAGTGA